MWYTYVLYSSEQDKFYIGFTADLDRRLQEHKRGQTTTTSRMDDAVIIYYEACLSELDARDRERSLKSGFGRQYLRLRLNGSIKHLQP